MDLFDHVLFNPWKQELVHWYRSEATTEVSDSFMQAESKRKQAANNFVVKRCSSNPTSDYFGPLKNAKLKFFKDLKAMRKVRN